MAHTEGATLLLMETIEEEKEIYQFFRISVILKGLISLAEVVVGTLLLIIPYTFFVRVVEIILQGPLRDPSYSSISEPLVVIASEFTAGTALFLAIYLLSRGLVKVFIIWGLLKNKLWAYPVSLVVLTAFLLYQFYQIYIGHGMLVVAISIFDIVVMYFIYREWRIVSSHQATKIS